MAFWYAWLVLAPSSPSNGDLWLSTADNPPYDADQLYVWDGTDWVPTSIGGIGEAPTDGQPYVRQMGAWVEMFPIDAGEY